MKYLRVGEMAKLNMISSQTLRFYGKIGLLCPIYVDEQSGYRYYDIRQSALLDTIFHLKEVGFSLQEIQEIVQTQSVEILCENLQEKSQKINDEIAKLNEQKRAINRMTRDYHTYKSAPPIGTIRVEKLPKRAIYQFNVGVNFYDHGLDVYEQLLRELKSNLVLKKLPIIQFTNVGTIMSKENCELRNFFSTEVFIFIDDDIQHFEEYQTIAGGLYLCMYCNDFHDEKAAAEQLFDEVTAQGYKIAGNYICEVLVEHPLYHENERGMFLKIQVPITRL